MIFQAKKVILACILSVFLVFSVSITAYASISDILAFGDSLSDNGRYKLDPAPYGLADNNNSADHYGFARYSNGPNWVDYLSQDISAPIYLNMAYGGATTRDGNPAAWRSAYDTAIGLGYTPAQAYYAASHPPYAYNTTTGLQWQVAQYGANFFSKNLSNTLITIWAGANDMFNFAKGMAGTPYSDWAMTQYQNGLYNPDVAADNIALAIQNLIGMGGKYFLVPNLNSTGNAWAALFDAALALDLAAKESANSGVDIIYLDLNQLTLTGIDNSTGTWLANSCDSPVHGPNCSNETFAYWDTVGVHPTTEVHQQIGAYAASAVPEPASIILLILGIAGLASVRKRMK